MPSRRDWLKGTAALLFVRDALSQGRIQNGVYRLSGEARVNGQPARRDVALRAGDTVRTGTDGEMVFVIGSDAFLVRRDCEVSLLKNGLRIATGAVLSVFVPGKRKRIDTPTAAVGIRGTGIYVEVEPERSYVCTCYGEAVIQPRDDASARETVRTRHHDQPRYVMAKGAPQMIMRAPVVNHTDSELVLLESLVGRRPPFAGKGYKPY